MLNDEESRAMELEKRRRRNRTRKHRRLAGYIRSRKFKRKKLNQIKIEPETNDEKSQTDDKMERIARPDVPYKKFRNPIFEIISQNEILQSRTRTNRRATQLFVSDSASYKFRNLSPKQPLNQTMPDLQTGKTTPTTSAVVSSTQKTSATPIKRRSNQLVKTESEKSISTPAQVRSPESSSRPKRRINYSEELVDEAFMYEQILDNQQHLNRIRKSTPKTDKKPIVETNSGLINIDSRLRLLEERKEISIMPVKSRLISKQCENVETKTNLTKKSEPLFNITSSVSVHIKPRKSDEALNEPALPKLHLKRVKNGYETTDLQKGRITCEHCNKHVDNLNTLAIHQLEHLHVSTHKIDSGKLLHPRLRRVSRLRGLFWQYVY